MSDDHSKGDAKGEARSPWASAFGKAAEGSFARASAALEGWAKLEEQMWEHCRLAVDESARLSKEAMSYAATTTAQARKLSMEAAQRVADSVLL